MAALCCSLPGENKTLRPEGDIKEPSALLSCRETSGEALLPAVTGGKCTDGASSVGCREGLRSEVTVMKPLLGSDN